MTLSQENVQVLNLVQAMLGAISPNFRRVALETGPQGVRLRFLLELDILTDREEIADIVFEFEALQLSRVDVLVDVLVDRRAIHEIDLPGRTVYLRKEAE